MNWRLDGGNKTPDFIPTLNDVGVDQCMNCFF